MLEPRRLGGRRGTAGRMLDEQPLDTRPVIGEENPEEAQAIAVATGVAMVVHDAAAEVLELRADVVDAAAAVDVVQLTAGDPLATLQQMLPDDVQRVGTLPELLSELIERTQPSPPARGLRRSPPARGDPS